jgi:hypothetical protein
MILRMNARRQFHLDYHICLTALALAISQLSCQSTPQISDALPAETARVATQSQCAQNIITCTRSFPTAVIDVEVIHGQTVTATDTGFLIEQPGYYGEPFLVKLTGSDSLPGLNATTLTYSWSAAATDADPCTLAPGPEFSTEAEPLVRLEPGLHYIRLTVTNDNILGVVESPQCEVIGENVPAFHFVEIELDLRS